MKATITSCTLFKEGAKNGKPWAMYNVFIEGDPKKYTTFNTKFQELIGQTVNVETELKDGKYWNIKLIEDVIPDKDINSDITSVYVSNLLEQILLELKEMNSKMVFMGSTSTKEDPF